MGWIKWAAACVHEELRLQPPALAAAIAAAAEQVATGAWDAEFPLSVWQTGSGTQSHMNVNEVIAALATQSLAPGAQAGITVHPNDDVNLGQSSNDVFTRSTRTDFTPDRPASAGEQILILIDDVSCVNMFLP